MSTTLEVALAIVGILVLNLFLRVTRQLARRPRTISWAWRHSLARPLGTPRRKLFRAPRRKPGEWVVRCAATVVAWHAGRPLRVQPFEGAPKTDPTTVSSALSAAMTRIASLRRSGVDIVTAPILAAGAVEAIAEGVKAAPAGGELAAALLRLGWWALARGELQLSGHVLEPTASGPGLALTIATGSGQVLERVTIRAGEFEPTPTILHGGLGRAGEADRLARVATAGAVWTHFKILEDEWHLSRDDLRDSLRTSDWRSYALMRVGAEDRDQHPPEVTRALYARAVDADPANLTAQFNLASVELKDAQLAQVRMAGMDRLELVHAELHPEAAHGSQAKLDGLAAEQRLLNCDPLHYQVSYKRVAANLNRETESEAKPSAVVRGQPNVGLGAADLRDITDHLCDLESTLALLCDEHAADRWLEADSKPWEQLRSLLAQIEGPMLVLWAMVARRVSRSALAPGSPSESLARQPAVAYQDSASSPRKELISSIKNGQLTTEAAVAFAIGPHVPTTSRTRFNLACWYADIDQLPDSLRELELSLECGGDLARHRLQDDQLRRLRERFPAEWRALNSRYAPSPASVNAHVNGSSPTRQSVARVLLERFAGTPSLR
ncbi:MAG: hypothetical protein WBQ21_06435 [Solirubrobacteraceae bacterium]